MRKIVLSIVCVLGIMSCGMGVPSSVSIKGKPGVHLPLGSPFTDGNRLEDFISPEKIKEMMDEGDDGSRLYDYQFNEDVQTYLIHYPIAEMKLDLTEYMNDITRKDDASFSIPFVNPNLTGDVYLTQSGPKLLGEPGYNEPLFKVTISEMAKLVIQVDGGPFGIEVTDDDSFRDKLQIRIPDFGIDDYIYGTPKGDKLQFVNPGPTTFKPQEPDVKDGIKIFARVTGQCSGIIDLGMVFEWETALVNTVEKPMKGEYVITNSLREYLGGNVTFKDVQGYIFVQGISKGAQMALSFAGNSLLNNPEESLVNRDFPKQTGDKFTGEIPEHSLHYPIPLADVLNSKSDSSKKIEYKIMITEFEISRDDEADKGKKITADLVIMLPLEFAVTQALSAPAYLPPDYVQLDLGDLFPEPGDGDLFFRTGENDNLFDQLEMVLIYLTNYKNTIFYDGNLSLLVYAEDKSDRDFVDYLKISDEDSKIVFNFKDDFPNPFSPRFHILLEQDSKPGTSEKEAYATFKVLPSDPDKPPVFDFHLAVDIKADINYTIDL